MIRRYVAEMADGSVSYIEIHNDKARVEDFLVRSAAAIELDKIVKLRETTKDVLPQDRTFRDAWTAEADQVVVNMPRARDIHMNRIRKLRDAKLLALDIVWSRAVAVGEPGMAKTIEHKRQRLRDIPQDFDLGQATTPDELKHLWPAELV